MSANPLVPDLAKRSTAPPTDSGGQPIPEQLGGRERSQSASPIFIALAVFLLLILGLVAAAAAGGRTVTQVNVADLPAGTPWQAIYKTDGSLGPPTVDCPPLVSWIAGDRPSMCGGVAATETGILILTALMAAGIGIALRILISRRRNMYGSTAQARR